MLTNRHLMELAERPGPWATICVPLSGGGPLAKQDAVRYRNAVRAIAGQLDTRATDGDRRDALLEPLRDLENDRDVFNAGAKGLVVFANEHGIEHWHMPAPLHECAVLDDRPFLEPLIAIVTDPMHFYVIVMSQHDVRLLECNRFVARQLPLPHGTPKRVEDAAGWQVEEPHLEFRGRRGSTGLGGAAGGLIAHTQGGGKDDREADLMKFVRDLDEGLWPAITHRGSPVVLMTSEKLDQIFRRMTKLPNIASPTLFGGWDRVPIEELHERARELVEPQIEERVELAKERFSNLVGSGSATAQIEQVVIAAADGRVDTLFVKEGAELEGTYDADTHTVRLGNGRADTTDLLARATTDAFLTGGTIYRLPRDRMPLDAEVAAILRY